MNTIQQLLSKKKKKYYTIFSIKNPHKKTRVIHRSSIMCLFTHE